MYDLEKDENTKQNTGSSLKLFSKYLSGQWTKIFWAMIFVAINSVATVVAPYLIGDSIDEYIFKGQETELIKSVFVLAAIYFVAAIATYFQILLMGRAGQSILFNLRNGIFNKLQSLPLAFFNQNKSGDLISRINNNTEKLNQAFSETLLRFIGNIFTIIGTALIMLALDFKLGAIALSSSIGLFIITSLISPWVKKKNQKSLDAFGELSGEIQESLSNFKVVIAFNRRDYFTNKFKESNHKNYKNATWATIANGILSPIYDFAGSASLLLVIIFGIDMIQSGEVTFGTLASFILYVDRFYQPLRIMAQLFTSIQTSRAAWTRISRILRLKTDLDIVDKTSAKTEESGDLVKFDRVFFGYEPGKAVLKDINFEIKEGKTYALIGPTGGGKSTTASLMARLYDPTDGTIYLHGRDIKSFTHDELSSEIGFILQEPFLFSGTIAENIKYGKKELADLNEEELTNKLNELGLEKVVERFKDGLNTEIKGEGDGVSLGQKQLVAFIRILLRAPRLLIMDEATANIDTVTEKLLQEIIDKLPKETTKIIIAHRLNTIKNADQLFFIANGEMEKAMNFDKAMELINRKESRS